MAADGDDLTLGRGAAPRPRPRGDESSSHDERERVLAEALAHAEARDARYRTPRPPRRGAWKGPVAVLIVLVAGVVLAVPPRILRGPQEAGLSPALRAQGARVALYLQAQEIEAFRLRRSRLPETLEEVARVPGVRWIRSNSRVYQVVTTGPDGRLVVYDAPNPDSALVRAAATALARVDEIQEAGGP